MNDEQATVGVTSPTAIYCPGCGQSMRIAREHLWTQVACPHCDRRIEPWRLMSVGTPPPAPPTRSDGSAQGQLVVGAYSTRNRWIAGALAVLLPGFGIHRFYMGFVGIGVWQIVATVVTCGIVGPIWGFIEGILCFCGSMKDVDGLPLRD